MTSEAHPSYSDYLAQQRSSIAQIARQAQAGTLSVLEAARLLVGIRHEVEVADDDPDFLVFISIDSQTDHLPIGSERQHWASGALHQLKAEIVDAEQWARAESATALNNLVRRFSTA